MKPVLKNFLTYGIGNALQSSLTFILLPLYLRYFAPEQYGVIASLSVLIALLTLCITAGVMNGLLRLYYGQSDQKKKELMGNAMAWYLGIAVVGAVLLYGLASPLSQFLFRNVEQFGIVRTVAFLFLFSVPLAVPRYALRLENRALQFVFLALFTFLVDFVLKLYCIVFLKQGVFGYFVSGVIANAISLVLGLAMTREYFRLSIDIDVMRQFLRLGAPYIVSGLAMWTLDISDRLLLARFSGQEAVGIYALANSFANIFTYLLSTPAALLADPFFFSHANERTDDENKALLRRMLTYFFLAGGALYLVIAVGTGEVLHMFTAWFGVQDRYLTAIRIVPIVALAPLIYFLASQAGFVGLLIKRPEIISAACLVAAVSNVVINLFAIPAYGALGAAVSTIVSYCILFGLAYRWTEQSFSVGYHWMNFGKLTLYLVLAFVAGTVVRSDIVLLSLLMKVLTAIVVFSFLSLFVGGAVSKSERAILLNLAPWRS